MTYCCVSGYMPFCWHRRQPLVVAGGGQRRDRRRSQSSSECSSSTPPRTLSAADAGASGGPPVSSVCWIHSHVPGRICITPRASALETRSLLKPLSCQAIASASDGGTPLAAAIGADLGRGDALGRRVRRVGRRPLGRRADRLRGRGARRADRRDVDVGAARRQAEHRAGDQVPVGVQAVGGGERIDAHAGPRGDRRQRVARLDDVGAAAAARARGVAGTHRPARGAGAGGAHVPMSRKAFGFRPLAAASGSTLTPARAAIADSVSPGCTT